MIAKHKKLSKNIRALQEEVGRQIMESNMPYWMNVIELEVHDVAWMLRKLEELSSE